MGGQAAGEGCRVLGVFLLLVHGVGTIVRAAGIVRRALSGRDGYGGALAVHAGVTAGTLARLELGQSDPSWSTICAVAKALDVRLREIVTAVETQHQAKTKER